MSYIFCTTIGFLVLFLVLRAALPVWHERSARALRAKAAMGRSCQACGSGEARLYVFRTCRCIGIAPIAAVWETSAREVIVCPRCAGDFAVAACKKLGLEGGWGFPGFVLVAVYAGGNVLELVRHRSARTVAVLRCIAWGVLLPWALLVLFLILLIFILTLVLLAIETVRR